MKRSIIVIGLLLIIPSGSVADEIPNHTLVINEVMAGSEVNPAKDHWIELYNPGSEEILLYGWQIRGVTLGGRWINVTEEDYSAIQPLNYFLLSHYSNSSSSALAIKPQVTKTSIQFPEGLITIELRDPDGQLADKVFIERAGGETDFHSYERMLPIGDGTSAMSWERAQSQVNLKEGLSQTFATPFAVNSVIPPALPQEPEEPDEGIEPLLPPIFINEILPNPKKRETENEFIELFNAGAEPVDLRGWELDDENQEDEQSYFFADEARDYIISPGGFLTLYRAETLISLENLGDGAELFDPDGNLADSYFYAPNSEGRSWGRSPEFFDQWLEFNHPTPGALNIEVNLPPIVVISLQQDSRNMQVNVTGEESYDPDGDTLSFLWEFEPGATDTRENPTEYTYSTPGHKTIRLTVTDEFGLSANSSITFDAAPAGRSAPSHFNYPDAQLINEFLPSPEGKDEENEWIELFNQTSETLNISGWFLDDAEGASKPFQIQNDTYLEAGQYILFKEPNLGLSLKNSDDEVRLLDPNKSIKQTVAYKAAKENWSYAKNPDGNFAWTPIISPGAANQFPAAPKFYPPRAVIIESALPDPNGPDADNEQLVLRNTTQEPIDLAGFFIKDAKGGRNEFAPFVLQGSVSRTFNQIDFKLSLNNTNESIILFDPAGNEMDRLNWEKSSGGIWILNVGYLQDGASARVTRVIDGDTFAAEINGVLTHVRLIGVDTPETVHPLKPVEFYGKQASDYLTQRLNGRSVILTFESNKTDRYGRLLAYIYLDGVFINAELVEKGYGIAYTRFPFHYLDEFLGIEAKAKNERIGLWQNTQVSRIAEIMTQEDIQSDNNAIISPDLSDEIAPQIQKTTDTRFLQNCSSSSLVIDSILPNPQKGEIEEFIRIKNIGREPVCFDGWLLDDEVGKGSKPFAIHGGGIEPGGIRTFFQSETKLKLNNQDDCAALISPAGAAADQICYKKTHKNEIFTHAGGNFIPKKKIAAKLKKPKKIIATTTTILPVIPEPELSAAQAQEEIELSSYNPTDDAQKMLYIESDGFKIPISYAGLNEPIAAQTTESSKHMPIEAKVTLLTLLSLPVFYFFPRSLL